MSLDVRMRSKNSSPDAAEIEGAEIEGAEIEGAEIEGAEIEGADVLVDPDNKRFDALPGEPLGRDLLKHRVISALMRSRW